MECLVWGVASVVVTYVFRSLVCSNKTCVAHAALDCHSPRIGIINHTLLSVESVRLLAPRSHNEGKWRTFGCNRHLAHFCFYKLPCFVVLSDDIEEEASLIVLVSLHD